MKHYSFIQNIKLALIATAVIIGIGALWYTTILVDQIAKEETKKMEIWATAIKEIKTTPLTQDINPILYQILKDNVTIPVIMVEENEISFVLNLDSARIENPKYLQRQLAIMQAERPPIELELPEGGTTYIYYKDSTILTQLFIFPFLQFGVVAFFVLVAYWAFSSSRNATQNQVWVGMSKETAHQLGTPISSLVAWIEILKMNNEDPEMLAEVTKDVKRLETITERFSKIGSKSVLQTENIYEALNLSLQYLQSRVSSGVNFIHLFSTSGFLAIPLNRPLFEWVIENLVKNAVDSMEGKGSITVSIKPTSSSVIIDISDTGKGIPKSKFRTIFNPGFTTKKRGWGLGLSLANRIIENNHGGRIYVKNSEPGVATTFRIIMPKETEQKGTISANLSKILGFFR